MSGTDNTVPVEQLLLHAIEAIDRLRGSRLSPMQADMVRRLRQEGIADETIERLMQVRL